MSRNDIQIRKAKMGDLDTVKSLADSNRASLGFVLRSTLSIGIEKECVLVAETHDRNVVGFVHYHHRQDKQTTIYEICVHEAFRGNGIGRALVQALTVESASKGKAYIRLKAPIDIPANKFYEAHGFALVGTETGKKRRINIWSYQIQYKDNGK